MWGAAVAEALGIGKDRFLKAYKNNIQRQAEEALNASMVAETVLKFTESKDEWKGTSTELLSELETVAEELRINPRLRGWPKAPHALARRLNQDRATLQAFGINVSLSRHGKKGTRLVTIAKVASAASAEGDLDKKDRAERSGSFFGSDNEAQSADAFQSADGISCLQHAS